MSERSARIGRRTVITRVNHTVASISPLGLVIWRRRHVERDRALRNRVGNSRRLAIHDVRDTVRAYATIIERGVPGRIYNVCAGRAFQIRSVLDALLGMSRVRVTVRIDPQRYRRNDNPILAGDRSRIEQELGWTPEIPLERTLADLLDYWRKEEKN